MATATRIEDLLAQARYHRHRLDLYRARMYGPRPTALRRFRELELASQAADARLRRAQHEGAPRSD